VPAHPFGGIPPQPRERESKRFPRLAAGPACTCTARPEHRPPTHSSAHTRGRPEGLQVTTRLPKMNTHHCKRPRGAKPCPCQEAAGRSLARRDQRVPTLQGAAPQTNRASKKPSWGAGPTARGLQRLGLAWQLASLASPSPRREGEKVGPKQEAVWPLSPTIF